MYWLLGAGFTNFGSLKRNSYGRKPFFNQNYYNFCFQYSYHQFYMIYKLDFFWLNFVIMTSQHGTRIPRFRQNILIDLGHFSEHIWVIDVTAGVKTAKFWESNLIKLCSFSVFKQVLFTCISFCNL